MHGRTEGRVMGLVICFWRRFWSLEFLSTFHCQKLKGGEGKRLIVGLCDFSISLFLFIFRFFIIPEKNSGMAAFSFCYPLRNQKRGEIITSWFSPLSSDDRLSVDCEEMKAFSTLFSMKTPCSR
ncbi:hypothetical protein GQ607_006130 [Colletotrichum asianum]|uniref:Uncharacterized protein n=1 Tax=Colletotrichum asianum TaxID=702518 RepID=A0A8H3ZT50_9PEZI|nr:hypothetical protein GQ607_006130 [Colletotrichum asianum]